MRIALVVTSALAAMLLSAGCGEDSRPVPVRRVSTDALIRYQLSRMSPRQIVAVPAAPAVPMSATAPPMR